MRSVPKRRGRRLLGAGLAVVVVVGGVGVGSVLAAGGSSTDVTTAAYDTLRTGWDQNEPNLSPSTVQSSGFGQIFARKLKGAIYAQPLVVGNLVIVTTEMANAYGIDSTTGQIVWSRNFGNPFQAKTIDCGDLTPDIGSTATPVEDPSTGLVYVTTRLQSGSGIGNAHWWLQAFSATTGTEASGFPVEIQGTPTNTPGVPFNDNYSMQRDGLLLLGGTVYMGFASDCDITPYRGVVAGVSTTSHSVSTMWSDEAGDGTDQNSQAGIWQGGGGLVSDGPGQILFTSGNGISPPAAPGDQVPSTLSESVVRLAVQSNGSLQATDFFAPADAPTLDQNDSDLGAGGPLALPSQYFGTSSHPDLLVQVGKDGRIFLLDRDHLGGREQGPGQSDDTLQTLGPYGGVWGHPAAYGGQGGWVYVLESGGGYLRALSYGVDSAGDPQLTSEGTSTGYFGYTSGSPTVTSNGTTAGSAIVWVVYSDGSNGKHAQLRAYGAMPSNGVLPLLWSSAIGTASKFEVPTASDGRVYVGSRNGKLFAFGSTQSGLVAAPVDFGRVPVGSSKTITVTAAAESPLAVQGTSSAGGVEALPPGTPPSPPAPAAPGSTTATTAPTASGGPIAAADTQPIESTSGVFRVSVPAVRLRTGGTVPVRITFTPQVVGAVVGQAVVQTSTGSYSVAVSGYGSAPGLLTSAPVLNYGVVDTGAGGKTLSVAISNSGNQTETITRLDLPTSPYQIIDGPQVDQSLGPQQSFTVGVRYDPGTPGVDNQNLVVKTDQGRAVVHLRGQAVTGTAVLSVAPATLSFGDIAVGQQETLVFTVSNTGNIPLTITRAAAPSGAFSTDQPLSEGITLDPGSMVHQSVDFLPAVTGPAVGTYLLTANNGQGAVRVKLAGTGTSSDHPTG